MFQLDSSMPYLLNRLGVRMGALFIRRLAPYGLTVTMFRVLASLAERPDQKLNELSATTNTEVSTMSRLISQMVDRGLVSRVRLPEDERTVRINLTNDGRALADELMLKAQHYEDVVVEVLDRDEVQHFRTVLARIYESLDVLGDELPAEIEALELSRRRRA